MKDILWLMRKTMINTFTNKMRIFIYIGLPVIGILISMFSSASAGGTLRVGIVNMDGQSVIAQDTMRFVEDLDQIEVSYVDEAELQVRIASGKLDSGIVILEGYSQGVASGRPGNLQIVSLKGAEVTAYIKSLLYNYVDNIAAISIASHGDPILFDSMYSGYQDANFKLTAEIVEDTSKQNEMTYRTIGYLVMFMLFSAVNLSEIITKEKENRTYHRLMSAPVTAKAYVLSNVAVNVMVMIVQISFTLIMMKVLFRINIGVPFWQMFLVLFMFALVAVGLSLSIVAFSKSTAAIAGMQNLIIVPSCLLAGCFFPMNIMPDTIKKISEFMPQHWLLDIINRLQQGDSLASLSLHLIILLGFAVVFALLAIYKFGRNNDTRIFV